MEPREVDETLLQAKGSVVLSLDDLGTNDEDSHPILDALADRDQPTRSNRWFRRMPGALVEAIERLPERQRLVLNAVLL